MASSHEMTKLNGLHPRPKPLTDTASLSGLRFFFNIFVVTLHSLVFLTIALDNPIDVNNVITGSIPAKLLSVIITLGNASVDIFLLISGFLLKSTFSNTNPTFFSSVRYTIFRYLRLAPAYLVIAFVLRAANAPNCLSVSEILLSNFGDSRKQCVGVGWSTQLDFVSHILLLPLLQHPQILTVIMFLTPPLRMLTWLRQGKPYYPTPATVTDFMETPEQLADIQKMLGLQPGNYSLTDAGILHRRSMVNAYYPLYFGLPYRIAAVVVGILVYSCMRNKTMIYRTVRKFPALSLSCMTLVWSFYYSVEHFILDAPLAQLIHNSAGRMSVAMATSVVIMLTCSVEDKHSDHFISRVLRRILTCRPVSFLQQFSYVVYLLHMMAAPALVLLPPKFNVDRFTPEWVLLLAFKIYMVTLLVGLPVWGIERLAMKGRSWVREKMMISGGEQGNDIAKKDV